MALRPEEALLDTAHSYIKIYSNKSTHTKGALNYHINVKLCLISESYKKIRLVRKQELLPSTTRF